jgi:hypothetical protein
VRGNVVTNHAQRIIVQFMAASCGSAKHRDEAAEGKEEAGKTHDVPDANLALHRVHDILDRMSAAVVHKNVGDNEDAEAADTEAAADARALTQTVQINDAMQLTARLWKRSNEPWTGDELDCRCTSLPVASLRTDTPQRRAQKSSHTKVHPKAKQSRAYITWKEACVQDWLLVLEQDEEAPTAEQKEFLLTVIDRCRVEQENFKKGRDTDLSDEPVRACLLGIPGAGKSTCIRLVRRFFEECLKWEGGVQFQFLASQNTMAALIGGETVHAWGGIPVNATVAAGKANTKGDEGDVDELFLKALSMRWLLLDEVSTLSPYLLGVLDAYLRRACCRHPYAKHGRHRRRPFGGINIVEVRAYSPEL